MRIIKTAIGIAFLGAAVVGMYVTGIMQGWYGQLEESGSIAAIEPRPPELHEARLKPQGVTSVTGNEPKQILFGDLHVHTTFSSDAFRMSLPMVQGDGTHPPADACDFARVCANLDFWALTDHAESLPPELWKKSVASVQRCNEIAGDPANPDMVTFMGYEWTQSNPQPEQHYGHKNIIFKGVTDAELPTRPIASPVRGGTFASIPVKLRVLPPLRDLAERKRYYDFGRLINEIADTPVCADNVNSRELSPGCAEIAATPADLFRKLDELSLPSIVIPHGTAWGIYSPPGTTLDKQLTGDMHDPNRQTLIEVYSGHGASEVYRDWRAVRFDDDGMAVCPEPTPGYLPSCWRAGEIIKERCLKEGADTTECDSRARDTRERYVQYGLPGWHVVPGTQLDDWLNAGQCEDCFLPAFNYRPGGSAQYGLAIGGFDESEEPKRFRFGFIASSDNHSARPGTGYKEYKRDPVTDWWGYKDSASRELYSTDRGDSSSSSPRDVDVSQIDLFNILELERQSSFFSTGGLVAVHSAGRDRESIWEALQAKEVYGTSGERILLWFEMMSSADNGRELSTPMGGEAELSENPRFKVQAMGSFAQKPGCTDYARTALNAERLELLCRGECYNPSSVRRPIERIEIVRIMPQRFEKENIAPLITDPWKVIECDQTGSGCSGEFEDEGFVQGARDVVYYARAIQQSRSTINANGLRCDRDEKGQCVSVNACFGDDRTSPSDNCAEDLVSMAWSSPIFVDFAATELN
ncbi:MAG: DUF3604 domain-containing protein [Gammaproteobacteria bacterium]